MKSRAEKIELFRNVFKARNDVVACLWKSKDGRTGYSPVCRNEWKKGICHKPCRTCSNADYVPCSDIMIIDHMKGKHVLGMYPLFADNTCNFIACDFDAHADAEYNDNEKCPMKDVKAFYEVCAVQDVPCYVLRSKSGKGYHLYLFFETPIAAVKARAVAFALLQEAEVISQDSQLSSFDRLFPNQDILSGRGLGNLIAMPFQGEAAKQGNTLILDPNSGFSIPFNDQWKTLAGIKRVNESQFDSLIQSWGLDISQNIIAPVDSNPLENEALQRLMQCHFMNWAKEEPEKVKEPLWYALLSNLIVVRPGGYSLCHELSKGHPRYSKTETDKKIHHALNNTSPHTCKYIKRNGFNCPVTCNVKSPVSLMFNRKTKLKNS